MIPKLDRFSGSWIAVCRETGRNVFETFSAETAKKINQKRYEVLTARDALARLNK